MAEYFKTLEHSPAVTRAKRDREVSCDETMEELGHDQNDGSKTARTNLENSRASHLPEDNTANAGRQTAEEGDCIVYVRPAILFPEAYKSISQM